MVEERLRHLEQHHAAAQERDKHLDATMAQLSSQVAELTRALHEGRGAVRILTGAFLLVSGVVTAVSHFVGSSK